jgi:hypothetical protein
MKTNVPVRKLAVRIVPVAAIAILFVTASFSPVKGIPTTPGPFNDTILVQKQIISKKYKIRLYPNASHEVLFFSVSGNSSKVYQLYLFDMYGTLVKQANIKNKQTTVLNSMEKGDYLFEVFSDDERIENGQVFIR